MKRSAAANRASGLRRRIRNIVTKSDRLNDAAREKAIEVAKAAQIGIPDPEHACRLTRITDEIVGQQPSLSNWLRVQFSDDAWVME